MSKSVRFWGWVIIALGWATAASAAPMPPQAAEFFEKSVRPVLATNCYTCHGDKTQMAGLRLDSLQGMLKGTDNGHSVLVLGEPDKSELIHVIQYTGSIKMPPTGKLADKDIQALTDWVKMGAPWPDSGKASAGASKDAWKHHWAFLPVRKPAIPAVKRKAWVKSPIDAFILAKLEQHGTSPAPPADRRTLIRRATFDLVGLPPTADEIEAFVKDRSPDAFAKVVDRLLASKRYGERWGRYWLDVARYADTKGYVFNEDRLYHSAYTYRDWVIRVFNQDMPYNQFLIDQIAADQVPLKDRRDLAAMV